MYIWSTFYLFSFSHCRSFAKRVLTALASTFFWTWTTRGKTRAFRALLTGYICACNFSSFSRFSTFVANCSTINLRFIFAVKAAVGLETLFPLMNTWRTWYTLDLYKNLVSWIFHDVYNDKAYFHSLVAKTTTLYFSPLIVHGYIIK